MSLTVAQLTAYFEKHCQPDWEVVLVTPQGDFPIAYADRSGSEKIGIIVPDGGRWTPKKA